MSRYMDLQGVFFHRVIALPESAAVEKHAEYLCVMLGRDAGEDHACNEQPDSTEQRMKEGEDCSSGEQSDKEQPPLCS